MLPSSTINYDSTGEDEEEDSTPTTTPSSKSRSPATTTTTMQRIDAFVEELGGWVEASIVGGPSSSSSSSLDPHHRLLKLDSHQLIRTDNAAIYAPTDVAIAGTRSFRAGRRPQPGQIVDVLDVTPTSATWETGLITSVADDRTTVRTCNGGVVVRVPAFSARLRQAFGGNSGTTTTVNEELSQQTSKIDPIPATARRVAEDFNSYCKSLYDQGLRLVRVEGDGNCMYRAASHQLYGNDVHHALVRKSCADFMELERAQFEPFTTTGTSFEAYVSKARQNTAWADHPEVQALCEVYERPVEVYGFDGGKLTTSRIVPMELSLDVRPPIRLSFFGGGHYDSIVSCSAMLGGESKLPTPPGVQEARATALAEMRKAGGLGKGQMVSDALATENETVRAVISASQQDEVEESLLNTAMEESLRFTKSSSSAKPSSSSRLLLGDDQDVADDDVDEALLRMAIQQSLDDAS